MLDPYAVLGVEASASASEIRSAYLAAAKANHPDKGGDPEAMGQVNQAYAILSDPAKRRAYDSGNHSEDIDPWLGQVAGILVGAFNAVLNQHTDIEKLRYLNITKETHRLIQGARQQMKSLMKTKHNDLKRQKFLLRRMKFKGSGINPLMGHLTQLIEQTKTELQNSARERLAMKEALRILDEYEYQVDERPPAPPADQWIMNQMRSGLNPNFFNQSL